MVVLMTQRPPATVAGTFAQMAFAASQQMPTPTCTVAKHVVNCLQQATQQAHNCLSRALLLCGTGPATCAGQGLPARCCGAGGSQAARLRCGRCPLPTLRAAVQAEKQRSTQLRCLGADCTAAQAG